MKKRITICILIFISSLIYADDASDLRSEVLGRWKLIKVQYGSDEPKPGYLELLGETELNPDGTCKMWFQYQTNPASSIVVVSGKWELEGDRFYAIQDGTDKRDMSRVKFDSGLMVITTQSENGPELYYYKKMQGDLPQNTIEGIKKDYIITLPNNWTITTPFTYSTLDSPLQKRFIKMRMRAVAFASANDGSTNGMIILNAASRKLSPEEMTRDLDDAKSIGVRTEMINGRKWRIENAVSETPSMRAYHASTYINDWTIRVFFSFTPSFTNNANDFVIGVLSTFETL